VAGVPAGCRLTGRLAATNQERQIGLFGEILTIEGQSPDGPIALDPGAAAAGASSRTSSRSGGW